MVTTWRVWLNLRMVSTSWLKYRKACHLTLNAISSRVDPGFSSNWPRIDLISSRLFSENRSTLQRVLFSSINFNHSLQTSLALTTSFVSKFLKVEKKVYEGRKLLIRLFCERVRMFVDGMIRIRELGTRTDWESESERARENKDRQVSDEILSLVHSGRSKLTLTLGRSEKREGISRRQGFAIRSGVKRFLRSLVSTMRD